VLSKDACGGDGQNPKRLLSNASCAALPLYQRRIARVRVSMSLSPAPSLNPLNTSQRVCGIRARSSGRCAPQMKLWPSCGSQA
jgi:hypothetical protein